ncbi:MAG: GGDEF domain-containing protein [Candidatus Brocadiia bacterium]
MRRSALRTVLGNIWFFICLVGAGSCFALAGQLLLHIPPLDAPGMARRVAFGVPALFGGLAALYGLVVSVSASLREQRETRLRRRLRASQRRLRELESVHLSQRARIDELSVLREVATVINQESDFGIIAEKVLELIDGLLEPLEITLFLAEDEEGEPEPFAHYENGKFQAGKKVPDRVIPDFDLEEFQSHSVVCRVHGQELHGLVPLKVEDKVLGVLLLVFPTDAREPEEQRADFNRNKRRVLQETCHHISLAVKTKHLHTRAVVDSLTRLYSRSHFQDQLQASVEFTGRGGETFSLVLLDIDHFKKINDTHGHATGDLVLNRLAGRLQRALRKYDTAYRYGGEELAVLLPRTGMREGVAIAERLRKTVKDQKFRGADGQLVEVTVSAGIAECHADDEPDSLFERADRRLYRAKRNGRNRVVPGPAAVAA